MSLRSQLSLSAQADGSPDAGTSSKKAPLPSAYRRREHENRRRGRPCIRKADGTPSYRRDCPRKLQSCRAAPLTNVPDEQFPMLLPYTFPPFSCPSGEQAALHFQKPAPRNMMRTYPRFPEGWGKCCSEQKTKKCHPDRRFPGKRPYAAPW